MHRPEVASTAQAEKRPHEVSRSALVADTEPEAESVRLTILRRMTPAEKVELVAGAIRTSRSLAMTGLRRRHPGASEQELNRRLMDLLLGEDLALRAYGPPVSTS